MLFLAFSPKIHIPKKTKGKEFRESLNKRVIHILKQSAIIVQDHDLYYFLTKNRNFNLCKFFIGS